VDDRRANLNTLTLLASGKYVPEAEHCIKGTSFNKEIGRISKLNATVFDAPHGRFPKHLFCIKMYSAPFGDSMDIITSSRRDTSENTKLTAASVTTMPALRMSRSDELQTEKYEFEEIVTFEQVVVRDTTARYDPKFEPRMLMLLRRWVEATNSDGKL
jgi:hypothetical protein